MNVDLFITALSDEQDTKKTRQKIGELLAININEVDELIIELFRQKIVTAKNCIPSKEAEHLHQELLALGVKNHYKPTKTRLLDSLSLEAVIAKFICPNCNHEEPLVGNQEPIQCISCGSYPELTRKLKAKQEQYELAKRRVLSERKVEQQLTLDRRKRQLKEKEEKELAEKIRKQYGIKKKWQRPATAYFIVTIVALTYYYSIPYVKSFVENLFSDEPSALNTAAIDTKESSEQQLSSQLNQLKQIAENLPKNDNHRELTANDIVNNSEKDLNKLLIQTNRPQQYALTQFIDDVLTNTLNDARNTDATQTLNNRVFLQQRLEEINNDKEWNEFLKNKINTLIQSGELKNAYELAHYQTNLVEHIDNMGALIQQFHQLKRDDLIDASLMHLQHIIQTQPINKQAIYSAELAAYLQPINPNKKPSFNEVNNLINTINDAYSQSIAISKLAVYEHQAGLTGVAQENIKALQPSLKMLLPNETQFDDFIAIAKDYQAIDANKYKKETELLFNNAESALKSFSIEQQQYSYTLLMQTALQLDIKKYRNYKSKLYEAQKDAVLYQYLQHQLALKTVSFNANTLLKQLNTHEYIAVASTLNMTSNGLIDPLKFTEIKQHLSDINVPYNQALAMSEVARYLYRSGQIAQALVLFDDAFALATALSTERVIDKELKDAVLAVLALDKTRVFLTDKANALIMLISNDVLQSTCRDHLRVAKIISNYVAKL